VVVDHAGVLHEGIPARRANEPVPLGVQLLRRAALTDAESAVARLAAEGNTNREVAEKLFISPHTVNTHLRHIFEKSGVNSRVTPTRIADQRETQDRATPR